MFNTLLKELRDQRNLTQGQLAKAAGVSQGNVGDWESGKSKPGYNALASLARIFVLSGDYLLELDTAPAKTSGGLTAYKVEQGLLCDGSPLDEEEADLVAMFRLLPDHKKRMRLISFAPCIRSTLNGRRILSTGHTKKTSSNKKTPPPVPMRPWMERLNFWRFWLNIYPISNPFAF